MPRSLQTETLAPEEHFWRFFSLQQKKPLHHHLDLGKEPEMADINQRAGREEEEEVPVLIVTFKPLPHTH